MRVLVGILGLAAIGLVLVEFFVTYLLPRRVKRDPRLARQLYDYAWRPWRALSRRLHPAAADTFLGMFGPLGLIGVLGLWTVGLILGFSALLWANDSSLTPTGATHYGSDLYFSAATFFSAGTDLSARGGISHVLVVLEAASGFGVLFIVIGYLPSLYQAFSRRETAVSQLDPRAGSPPSAGALLRHVAQRGGWTELDAHLYKWEAWAAELMETHLSYPILAYFRSQHVNQSWLSALTTVLDSCSFAIAAAPVGEAWGADLTYAIGLHAVSDLAHTLGTKDTAAREPRLSRETLEELCRMLEEEGLEITAELDDIAERLRELTEAYEPRIHALAQTLELPLPVWLIDGEEQRNWQRSGTRPHRRAPLP